MTDAELNVEPGENPLRCEVCGEEAVILVRDYTRLKREYKPFRRLYPRGPIHSFCREHRRDPVIVDEREVIL